MKTKVKRQFNYTQRVKIPKHAVKLRAWQIDGSPPRIVVEDFGLANIEVPHNSDDWQGAQVVLEANRHTTSSFQRIVVGSVAEVAAQSGIQYSGLLADFDSDQNIVFTIKVVSAKLGKLLAEAKNIRNADDGAEKHELLRVQEYDLGEEPWRLMWEDGIGPIIQVNKRLAGGGDNFLTRDAFMQGAVMPAALRMVLLRLVQDREQHDEPWGKQWLRFAAQFAFAEMPTVDDEGRVDWEEAERWVNGAVNRYAERFAYTTRINDALVAPTED